MPEGWKQWEGQIVNSRFVLRQYLGGSDHSAVFLTERQNASFDKAAIKLIPADPDTKDFHLARWHDVAQLSHPHLLRLFHYGQCKLDGIDLLYVVTELADEDLARILPTRALNALEAREVLVQTAEPLSFLHSANFIHRRVQPSNILAVGDEIKLSSDSVCMAAESPSDSLSLTAYDAPEITGGGKHCRRTAASDIYSLAVSIVESLTQRVPAPGYAAPAVPAPFDEIADRAMHSDPELRWTAGDILRRLNSRPTPQNPASDAAVPASAVTNVSAVVSAAPQAAAAVAAATAIATSEAKPVAARAKSLDEAQPAVQDAPIPPRPKQITAESLSSYHVAAPLPPERIPVSTMRPSVVRKASRSGLFLPISAVAVLLLLVFLVPKMFRKSAPADLRDSTKAASAPSQASSSQGQVSSSPSAPRQTAKAQTSSKKLAPQNSAASKSSDISSSRAAAADVDASVSSRTPAATPVPTPVRSSVSDPSPQSASANGVTQKFLPDLAQKALDTIHGTVRVGVRVAVNSSGNVQSADLANPSGSEFFNKAALQAAKRWQFQSTAFSTPERSWLLHFEFTRATIRAQASQSN